MFLGYQNGKIKFYTEEKLDTILYNLEKIEETDQEYVLDNDEYVLKDEAYEQKQLELQQKEINNLTMTALDFINVLVSFGISLEVVNEFLESNLPIKMQLTYCQNVYCGVVKQYLPLTIGEVEITEQMIEQAFKLKNGKEA